MLVSIFFLFLNNNIFAMDFENPTPKKMDSLLSCDIVEKYMLKMHPKDKQIAQILANAKKWPFLSTGDPQDPIKEFYKMRANIDLIKTIDWNKLDFEKRISTHIFTDLMKHSPIKFLLMWSKLYFAPQDYELFYQNGIEIMDIHPLYQIPAPAYLVRMFDLYFGKIDENFVKNDHNARVECIQAALLLNGAGKSKFALEQLLKLHQSFDVEFSLFSLAYCPAFFKKLPLGQAYASNFLHNAKKIDSTLLTNFWQREKSVLSNDPNGKMILYLWQQARKYKRDNSKHIGRVLRSLYFDPLYIKRELLRNKNAEFIPADCLILMLSFVGNIDLTTKKETVKSKSEGITSNYCMLQ